MILRLWSGWTTPGGAADYDELLDREVAPQILRRDLPGLERFEVWRRVEEEEGAEPEFLTAMWFSDVASVRAFTGGDPHASVVPPRARERLARFDTRSRHYELRRRHR
ncbi:hypothetical protein [Auraticoccus monumenti]|uniref:Antibiotic biosynthesis monooxygenase n=1 Tax=Auraticoccus monumenti TaxID=675864 RepID=A0A1G6RNE3_9ACTN|nr:hypothetical protein [Auraticoccus monumenti]SDD05913.1 hypothetical protein SAMN04489747_0069 [Auraticoccus monumenti]